MSYYENTKRWLQSGVHSKNTARALAPGFGRNRDRSDLGVDGEINRPHEHDDRNQIGAMRGGEAKNDPRLMHSDSTQVRELSEIISTPLIQHTSVESSPKKAKSSMVTSSANPSQVDKVVRSRKKSMGFYDGRSRPQIDSVEAICFQNASVEEVRSWAAGVAASGVATNSFFNFSFNPVPFEPDFKLTSLKQVSKKVKRVTFSPCTKVPPRQNPKHTRDVTDIDLEHVILFTLEENTFTMFPQLIESPSLPLDSLPSLEEHWEKLTILLWAAFLAENDLIMLKIPNNRSDSIWENNEVVGRKLFILHAALFELIPEEDSNPLSDEYRETLHKLQALAATLSPSDEEGMTPLAIASLATTPTSFNTFRRKGSTNLSQIVIQKLVSVDVSMARKPFMNRYRGIKRQLPLHIILQSGKNWDEGVQTIFEAYPDAAVCQDDRGRLPLHAAASSVVASGWAIHKIVQYKPQSVRVRDHDGRLPLHLATEAGKKWSAGTESIFAAYPEAAFVPDFAGQIPPYYQLQDPESLLNGGGPNPTTNSLLDIMLGDMSSKGVVHQGSKRRKRQYSFFTNFSSAASVSDNSIDPIKPYGASAYSRRQLVLPSALHLTVLPELMELLSNPLKQ